MEITVKELEGCRRQVEITVPSDQPDAEYNDMLNDFRKSLQVPGFRRGKVPASVIEQRFGKELTHEVIEKMVPKALGEALEKENLTPVEQPVRDEVSYRKGEPLHIIATFEIRPEVTLKKHSGLEVKIDASEYEITDEKINEQLENLRDRSATFETVELIRPIAVGDFAVVDLRGEPKAEGAVPFKREDITIEVVEDDSDGGFSKNLIGAQVEDSREFTVDYPDDFEDEVLAGTSMQYSVDIKQLKKKVLPELDDEFARDLGQFEDLDGLKNAVKAQLEGEAARKKRHDTEKALIDALIEENPDFILPQVMVQRELARLENELRQQMGQRGVNPDHIGFDWTAFRKEAREQAEWNVRRILFLDTIGEKENIEVSPKEIRSEIDAMAASWQQDARELRREMLEDGRYEALGQHIREFKTVDWLIDNNTVKED